MKLRVEMTRWLADLAGCETLELDLPPDATIADLRPALARLLSRGAGARLVSEGALHASVLVTIDGELASDGSRALAGGECVRLLLPVAGG